MQFSSVKIYNTYGLWYFELKFKKIKRINSPFVFIWHSLLKWCLQWSTKSSGIKRNPCKNKIQNIRVLPVLSPILWIFAIFCRWFSWFVVIFLNFSTFSLFSFFHCLTFLLAPFFTIFQQICFPLFLDFPPFLPSFSLFFWLFYWPHSFRFFRNLFPGILNFSLFFKRFFSTGILFPRSIFLFFFRFNIFWHSFLNFFPIFPDS